MLAKTAITIEVTVNTSVEKVWNCFTQPEHVKNWNFASDEWHCPAAENDLQVGGKFNYTMAAKDGSFSFEFWGIYTKVEQNKSIEYTLGDDRKVWISFSANGNQTTLVETFEAETENAEELQRSGWQMILNNFKKYSEEI